MHMKTLIRTAALVVLTAACTAKPAPEKLQAVDFTKVEADRGLVALERGPVVYCFEEVDNGKIVKAKGHDSLEDAREAEVIISNEGSFVPEYKAELLGGVVTLSNGSLTAVPYCVWDNRGDGQMSVWLKR